MTYQRNTAAPPKTRNDKIDHLISGNSSCNLNSVKTTVFPSSLLGEERVE